MARLWLSALLLLHLGSPQRAEEANPAARMFERLKGSVGEWQGSFRWSGARSHSGAIRATYALGGNGSALVENLIVDGAAGMTTVYHLHGAELRMTHYCAARNQPRLNAHAIQEEDGELRFRFLDITGATESGFVESFVLRLNGRDRLALTFTFRYGEQRALEHIELRRQDVPARGRVER
jgi:hypothetical protein